MGQQQGEVTERRRLMAALYADRFILDPISGRRTDFSTRRHEDTKGCRQTGIHQFGDSQVTLELYWIPAVLRVFVPSC